MGFSFILSKGTAFTLKAYFLRPGHQLLKIESALKRNADNKLIFTEEMIWLKPLDSNIIAFYDFPEQLPQVEKKLMPWISFELTDEQQTEDEFLQQAKQIRQLLNEQDVTYNEARVSIMREYDNTDGSRAGYAPIYYEGLYLTMFTPETKELVLE